MNNRTHRANVAYDGPGGRYFGVGFTWAVATVEGLRQFGRGAPGRWNVNIVRASLVQDGTTIPSGRVDELSLRAGMAARTWDFGARRFGAGRVSTRHGGIVRSPQGVWLGGPILGEGVEPGMGRHFEGAQ